MHQATNPRKPASDKDVANTFKINSMKLIHLVRSHEVLYNSHADGYNDKSHKDLIWEQIVMCLFPKLKTFPDETQEKIGQCVRRRWKTLRNSIAREVRKSATVENYTRKKESPIISELEFLIPHIKSEYCARLTDELGLRECYAFVTEPDDIEEGDYSDLIDLTDEVDVKPLIKVDDADYISGIEAEPVNSESEKPSLESRTNISDINANVAPAASWSREFCALAEYKGGEFRNSLLLCPTQENDEPTPSEHSKPSSPVECKKRARLDTIGDSTDLQTKMLQLLANLERRDRLELRTDQDPHDEDRMFLLSLVTDLKKVPPSKKMLVKAEIATAIARAAQ